MFDDTLNNYVNDEDDDFLDFEFSPIPYESLNRQFIPPFMPGGYPPFGGYPYIPNNYPGGISPPQEMPSTPPQNYIPIKDEKGEQSLSYDDDNKKSKNNYSNSIKFCLYKFTYIWERNGRSYWAFLLNADRYSISGFRWLGRIWVYFGLNLRRIDSFYCQYTRNLENDLFDTRNENTKLNKSELISTSIKSEYSSYEEREIFSAVLTSLDIPEFKEDSLSETIGYVNEKPITTNIPCKKSRNISYRITLEVSYPKSYDKKIKNTIIDYAANTASSSCEILNNYRNKLSWPNPIESFNSCSKLIQKILNSFTQSFKEKLLNLNLSQSSIENIKYVVREEKIIGSWKTTFDNR